MSAVREIPQVLLFFFLEVSPSRRMAVGVRRLPVASILMATMCCFRFLAAQAGIVFGLLLSWH
jgi:hypothetical protein